VVPPSICNRWSARGAPHGKARRPALHRAKLLVADGICEERRKRSKLARRRPSIERHIVALLHAEHLSNRTVSV